MKDVSLRYAGGQIVGRRNRQEDEYGVLDLTPTDPKSVLLTVADGMGGYAGGAEAAHSAVRGFLDAFETNKGETARRLNCALDAANYAVAALKQQNPSLDSAGCTLVAAAVEDGVVSWISVGDSSLFRLRDGVLERLNADHSMRPVLEEMVAVGRMTMEEVNANPNRNALRSAVAGEDIELVDLHSNVALDPGDQLLLASDGLNVLPPARIAQVLEGKRGSPIRDAVTALLEEVEALGIPRQDNTTVIVYRVAETARQLVPHARFGKVRPYSALAATALLAGAAAWWFFASGPGHQFAQDHGLYWSISGPGPTHPASGKK